MGIRTLGLRTFWEVSFDLQMELNLQEYFHAIATEFSYKGLPSHETTTMGHNFKMTFKT